MSSPRVRKVVGHNLYAMQTQCYNGGHESYAEQSALPVTFNLNQKKEREAGCGQKHKSHSCDATSGSSKVLMSPADTKTG